MIRWRRWQDFAGRWYDASYPNEDPTMYFVRHPFEKTKKQVEEERIKYLNKLSEILQEIDNEYFNSSDKTEEEIENNKKYIYNKARTLIRIYIDGIIR
jgi:recombinational DNA repair ATPase RecF